PGGGQMYAEKMGRGLALLLSSIVIVVFGALISVVAMAPGSRGGNSGIPVVILAIAFILAFWIWNVYDAYKQANKYNDMRFH
ncbi:MAG: hypothetical protein FWH45_02735, partial [Methanomassiliicoccaceae archaeon]|nr:hypothetical protein [Methanomassiliicoccaceae archaeon]